jgi:hypothetical protein
MILAATKSSGGSPAFTFIILAVLVGLFYVLIMRPQRNRQRKASQTQSAVSHAGPADPARPRACTGRYLGGDRDGVVIEIAPACG